MRILIAGSSGYLGSHLTDTLTDRGHHVTRLVRRSAEETAPGTPAEQEWDPENGVLDPAVVAASDVVVNLAGSPTMGNPHSARWARRLRDSRVTTTRLLAEAIAEARRPPAFLAGNGISYYGDRGDEVLDESADSRGDALMPSVTREWQEAAEPAAAAGARVCILRTAPVMDRSSEPLKTLTRLYLAGGGAQLGNGRQYFPVITRRDWMRAVVFAAEHETLSGPLNLCCPETPTQAEFHKVMAEATKRPAFLKVPSLAIRAGAGRMGPELLGSLRTTPKALLDAGFTFHDHDVREVLAVGLFSHDRDSGDTSEGDQDASGVH